MFFFVLFLVVVIAAIAASGIRVIHQQSIGIVESFGKFSRVLQPGLQFIIPVVESVVSVVDLRVQEITGEIEIKTKDNVFVALPVALMTQVIPESAEKSHYLLAGAGASNGTASSRHHQVSTWALNALRATAAGLTLQELFEDRERLAAEVKNAIDVKMQQYGFHVVDVLVDQPTVAEDVQSAFNRVVASRREREAAEQEAEAKRIRILGEARAESEAQGLRAEGVAKARSILAAGLTSAMEQARVKGVDEQEILGLLVETNRMDTIRSAAEHGKLVVMDLRSPTSVTLPLTDASPKPQTHSAAHPTPAA